MSEREARVATSHSVREGRVFFHPEQLKYLEEMFPEMVLTPTATPAEIQQYFGTRRVVHFVRGKVK